MKKLSTSLLIFIYLNSLINFWPNNCMENDERTIKDPIAYLIETFKVKLDEFECAKNTSDIQTIETLKPTLNTLHTIWKNCISDPDMDLEIFKKLVPNAQFTHLPMSGLAQLYGIETLLHKVTHSCNPHLVEYLCSIGSDIHKQNRFDQTALDKLIEKFAHEYNEKGIFAQLILSPDTASHPNNCKKNYKNMLSCTKILINHGAKVNNVGSIIKKIQHNENNISHGILITQEFATVWVRYAHKLLRLCAPHNYQAYTYCIEKGFITLHHCSPHLPVLATKLNQKSWPEKLCAQELGQVRCILKSINQ